VRAQRSDDVRPDNLPAFLRVEEVAKILRISRSAAYEMANAWLATGGETGLPAVRLGRRSLRVPRAAVERLLRIGTDNDVV
jgi:excisionase family DNA binding protein